VIVTLTPNPGIDRTYAVEMLARGDVNRSGQDWIEAGGKGINVARVLRSHGDAVRAVLPIGGPTGQSVVELLARDGVELQAVAIAGDLRCNITVAEPDGTVTKLNAVGPTMSGSEVKALIAESAAAVVDARADWFVGCGSLPPGAPDDLFARVIRKVRSRAGAEQVRIAIDSSGPALSEAIAARPDVIKPNLAELEELSARPLTSLGEVTEAARALVRDGVGTVLVSLGSEGALLIDAQGEVFAEAPVTTVRTTVGAGDALLAGYLRSAHRGPLEALRVAVAFGAAAVQRRIGAIVGPTDIDVPAVIVTAGFDRARPSRARRESDPAGPGVPVPASSSGGRSQEGEGT
jgi:1-phosphofructokinase